MNVNMSTRLHSYVQGKSIDCSFTSAYVFVIIIDCMYVRMYVCM